jgi:hypothetical protein
MDDLIENLPNARRKQEEFDYLAQGRKYNLSNKMDNSESFLDNRKGSLLDLHSKNGDMFNFPQPSFEYAGYMGELPQIPGALESFENSFDQGKFLVNSFTDNQAAHGMEIAGISNNTMFPHSNKHRLDDTPKGGAKQDSPVIMAAQFSNFNDKYAPNRHKISSQTMTEQQIQQLQS